MNEKIFTPKFVVCMSAAVYIFGFFSAWMVVGVYYDNLMDREKRIKVEDMRHIVDTIQQIQKDKR